jgi:predicted metal-dependent enzyme (double-stranded beta helix superfamily)
MNITWAPCTSQVPHNHKMSFVVGIYADREGNVIWRRTDATIEAAGARSLGVGDVATWSLGQTTSPAPAGQIPVVRRTGIIAPCAFA